MAGEEPVAGCSAHCLEFMFRRQHELPSTFALRPPASPTPCTTWRSPGSRHPINLSWPPCEAKPAQPACEVDRNSNEAPPQTDKMYCVEHAA